MNVFQLKLLAVITMLIDHIGLFFFPQEVLFRVIGRLSFPLFAWLVANGAHHTHNIWGYILRLFMFAFVAQIPFLLANRMINPSYFGLNVLFTLGLGLTAIKLIQKTQSRQAWVFIAVLFGGIAQILQTDYGLFGVLVIVCFYLFFKRPRYLFLSQLGLFLFPFSLVIENRVDFIQPLGILALIFIFMYNQRPGLKLKYWFYIIYPLQYVIIYVIQRLR